MDRKEKKEKKKRNFSLKRGEWREIKGIGKREKGKSICWN